MPPHVMDIDPRDPLRAAADSLRDALLILEDYAVFVSALSGTYSQHDGGRHDGEFSHTRSSGSSN